MSLSNSLLDPAPATVYLGMLLAPWPVRTRFLADRTLGSPRRILASGGGSPEPGQAIPTHCRMITCANVRDVTLSSPGEHAERTVGPLRRWRGDLNPRRGCPLTRFRGVRPRPLGDSTVGEPTRTGARRGGATRRADGGPRRTRAARRRTPRPGHRR